MKMKRFVIMLLLVSLCLTSLCVNAADRELKMERAIQINDTQIVIEFSEPIMFDFNQEGVSPWIAIRLVSTDGYVQKVTDMKSPYYGNYLQWEGSILYVDIKHYRLLFTLTSSAIGVNTLDGILNYEGELANYKKFLVAMTLEEKMPTGYSGPTVDNEIRNVTTRDGEVHLTPTRRAGYEACNIPIEVDYSYRVDLSATESTAEIFEATWDYPLASLSDKEAPTVVSPKPEVEEKTMVLKNDGIVVAALIGGGALICAGLIVLSIVIRKRRKVA